MCLRNQANFGREEVMNAISKRANDYIKDFLVKYKIAFDINNFSSVFITFNEWSFRLFVNTKAIDGTFKNRCVYNFSKKKVDKATMSEIYETREDFIKFTLYVEELKYIKEIEKNERSIESVSKIARSSLLTSLK